jgi:hypothetical protein
VTPETPPATERSWTEFGYQTREQYEARLEWERTARDVCACRHMRQEHGPGCLHVYRGPAPVRLREPCRCEGWTAPEHAPGATETAQGAAGVYRTADGGVEQ